MQILIQTMLSLLLVLSGWALHELSDYLRSRREDRKPIAKALSIILELRQRVLADSSMSAFIAGIPPADAKKAKKYLSDLEAKQPDMSQKYSEAIEILSGTAPFVAFTLRGQDMALDLLRKLSDADIDLPQRRELSLMALRNLNVAALLLSKMHSRRTLKEFRRFREASPQAAGQMIADIGRIIDPQSVDHP
jgi:hypothetical protein